MSAIRASSLMALVIVAVGCGPAGSGDGIPDLPDGDGDNIADTHEGREAGTDSDGDGTPDFRDADSDGDGIGDIDEAGDALSGTPPLDADGDGVPDFRDLDSDENGLADGSGTETTEDLDRDGIGNWGVQDFVDAMAAGVSPNGQHLYPAFPYTSYRLMPPKALADLFAYIRTLAPVEGRAPPHELPFPFNIRRMVGGWKLLFFEGAAFRPDPTKSESWNRGAYLVNGPGHCAECHSARNGLGAIIPATRLAGGPDPEGKGWVPNITPHADGIASWSAKDIAYLLQSGLTPESDSVGSNMADVVRNTAKLSDADRNAMAAYLKALPALPGGRPRKSNP